MYSYTFNGKIYSAKTLPELQTMLEAQGFKGDVIKIYNELALQTLDEEEQLSNQDLNQDEQLPNEEPDPSSDELLEEELALDYMNDGLDKLN